MMPPLPSNAFSLAAIVRSSKSQNQSQHQEKEQQYVLVHERFPRGWWLPGGGIEHKDSTPVDAAVRETIEEAALPHCKNLPVMTHLLSLEQSPGRIRFIFRGEWCDDVEQSILKCPPGDDDSIEAKWVTWDEVNNFKRRRKHIPREQWLDDSRDGPHQLSSRTSVNHPWLRGHEPLTFFGMLEQSLKQNNNFPGLKVCQVGEEDEVVGAFFSRQSIDNEVLKTLTIQGRAVYLIHLKCHLIAYDSENKQFALVTKYVGNQNEETLRQLADEMLSQFTSLGSETGLLRVEYVAHENGREATLTVFPYAITSSNHEFQNDVKWFSKDELVDSLDQQLAAQLLAGGGNFADLNILRDTEREMY
mmetsp:Transcript_563/g.724  ORF Transcript_563/g.724 Transcript_563/m.724 type:complete len:360 (+) Transcript_563:232-1311(+)